MSSLDPILPSCSLDAPGLSAQRGRYARLATSVVSTRRRGDALVVSFDATLDTTVLDGAIAVERRCCPFLRFSRVGGELRVTVGDPEQLPALDAIEHALTGR